MTALQSSVPANGNGRTLADWLAARFTYLDAAAWQCEVAAGRVQRNGERANADDTLRTGDVIRYSPPANERSATAVPVTILHADDDLVAVDKPARFVAHRDGAFVHNTFLRDVERTVGATNPLHLVHRLDRDTSGVLLLARRAEVVGTLQQQFGKSLATKEYVAIVRGRVAAAAFTIDAPLGPAQASSIAARRAVVDAGSPGARRATTDVEVIERFADHSLLRVHPRTGRTHQIRVHLAHVGHPVLFDPLYGATDDEYRAHVLLLKSGASAPTRHLLHAAKLSIVHPTTSAPLHLEAPWPPDFTEFVDRARTIAAR